MPLGSRSRACKTCQRRKVKCDEKAPVCAKCESWGLECSGPVLGPIILPFDPQKPKKAKRQQHNVAAAPVNKDTTDSNATSASNSLTPYVSYSIRTISDSPAVRDFFALKLQDCVLIPHQQYESIGPELTVLSSSGEYPGLQQAIWATSSALNGAMSNTPDLIEKGRELYSGALKHLLRELAKDSHRIGTAQLTSAEQQSLTANTVGVAALSVWFEAIVGNTPNGWIAHAYGACRLLLRRLPEEYRLGMSHKLFRTVRYMAANCSIMTIQSTRLGSPPWLRIPFSLVPKSPFDRVTDFMLTISKPLSWIHQEFANGIPIASSTVAASVREEVTVLEQESNNFLVAYEIEMAEAGNQELFLELSEERLDPAGEYHPKVRQYPSDAVAECLMHYALCGLLIALMKGAFCNASDAALCRAEALEFSASILAGIGYGEANTTTHLVREHFGFVCILIMVLVTSPSEAHRKYARLKIETYGGGNGLVGTSAYHPAARWAELSTIWEKMALGLDNVEPSFHVEEGPNRRVAGDLESGAKTV